MTGFGNMEGRSDLLDGSRRPACLPCRGCHRADQEGEQGPRAGRSDPVLRNGLVSQVFRGLPGWDSQAEGSKREAKSTL